jgi:flagellar hook-basal body complex protein FliE
MATAAVEGPNKIHETMIQLEEAEISTRLLLKVRSKALDAYQEIMRMQF